MKLVINSKSNDVKGFIKKEVEKRFEKLDKYFTDEASANVMFSEEGQTKKVEITLKTRSTVLRSEVSDNEYRTAADRAIDRIEKQLIKYKEKLKKRNTESIRYENIESSDEVPNHFIVKRKKFKLEPISTDEACFRLELLGHQFYMFLNEGTDTVNVVYRRADGDYGLIEPES